MPPKAKFSKEEIVASAVEIVRTHGSDALTARALGQALGSSPRPIFTVFQSMEEVRREVIAYGQAVYQDLIAQEIARGKYPFYKSYGMAYIRFARQERELFKLLYMRDRTHETPVEDGYMEDVYQAIMQANGITREQAMLMHLENWICVHGIATMLATAYYPMEEDLIAKIVSDAYQGSRNAVLKGEDHESH